MSNLALTAEEQDHVRAALQFLRRRIGTWKAVAAVLGKTEKTIQNQVQPGCRKSVTPDLAFRVARFAGVGVDDVLTGRFPEPGTCPYCGHAASTPVVQHEP